jgi:hypothetical protein
MGHPRAGNSRRDEGKYQDKFNTEHMPEERMEYEDSVPMDRRPTLPVADVLGAKQQERSWESAQGSRWFQPAAIDRSQGIGDLGMAVLHIGAPDRQKNAPARWRQHNAGRRSRGATPHLFQLFPESGLPTAARVDHPGQLFRQEMRYPERGAGGFYSLRRAGAGESRDSPPVQLLEVSEYQTASESASERGRSRHRGHLEDRPSAGLEEIRGIADHEKPEPASWGEERGTPASASHHFGSSRPWEGAAAADRPPMPLRHSASAPLPPMGPQGVPPPRRGESMQQPRRGRYDSPPRDYGGSVPKQPQPQASNWAGQSSPPIVGLRLEAMQGMTNARNAIANQVIRNSGRSTRNPGWPYFDGIFRDYPAFKRKFASFRANYHRGTPTQELFQQFREMCLPEKIAAKLKMAETTETAWVRLDAWYRDQGLFIKGLMQDIKNVTPIKDVDDERLMDYYLMLQSHIAEARSAGLLKMLLIPANVEMMVLPLFTWEKRVWREVQDRIPAEDRAWYMEEFVEDRLA